MRRRPVVIAALVALLLSGTAAALASTGRAGTSYRTTTAQLGDVNQLLNLTGTIAVINHASAGFPVAGTVATVNAHVGDTVKAGQVLATLATAPLTDAVTQAVAQLAQTQATLQTDQTAAATSTPSATPTPTTTAATNASSTGSGRSSGHAAGTGTAAAQRALTQAQARAAQAMTRAAHAVAAGELACAPTGTPSATPSATPSLTASPFSTASATPTTTSSPTSGADPSSCQTAQATALTALEAVGRAQQGVAQAEQVLTTALAATMATSASGNTTSGSTAGATSRATTSASGGSSAATSTSRSSSGQGTQSPAARITLDQAAVVNAQAALDAAHRNLTGATLTSPIAGAIAQQPFSVSATEAPGTTISIIGPGAVEVTVNVPATSLTLVKVGQRATVIANGATTPVAGAVTAIGLLPVATTSNTSAYPVTIHVPQPSRAFVAGAAAAVTVVVKTVTAVLTVPDSAVTLNRGRAFVNVLTAGKPVRTAIQVGAIGPLLTQITSGVTAGQILELADPTQSLPASSATLPTIRQFGPGGAGGGFGGGRGTGGVGQGPPNGG